MGDVRAAGLERIYKRQPYPSMEAAPMSLNLVGNLLLLALWIYGASVIAMHLGLLR